MKKTNAIFAVLLVIGVLGGCDFLTGPDRPAGNGSGDGNLSISLGTAVDSGKQRAVTSGADLSSHVLAALRYELTLTGPGGELITRTVRGGENLLLTVALGMWRIDAEAYLEDALAGTGSQSFTVMPGDNSILIPMEMNGGYFDIILDPSIPNGMVSSSFAAAFPGTTVTLTVTPGSDYFLKTGTLKYSYGGSNYTPAGSGPYTFTMPASDVTVRAELVSPFRYVRQNGTGDGTSWENASGDLQAMVDGLASLRDEGYTGPLVVKVGAGTYKPKYKPNSDGTIDPATAANDRDSVFILREGVEIRGGYAAAGEGIDETSRKARFNPDGTVINAAYRAVLSGDFNGDDNWSTYTGFDENAYHVVVGMNIAPGSGTVLDGLTITGGNANATGGITVEGNPISRRYGGGLYNYNSAPSLTNVVLSSSWAGTSSNGSGGGMYNYQSSPALTGVTISGNNSIDGGGMYNDASSPVLNHVVITGNGTGTGGGMYNANGSAPTLTNVTISGNMAGDGSGIGGGGMYNTGSSPVLTNVTISENTANSEHGGGMYNRNSSAPILTNVTISGNTVGGTTNSGGGMYNANSSPVLNGGSISNNAAPYGGGIGSSASSPVLTNVTISGNSSSYGGGMYNNSSSSSTLTNVTISGNTATDKGGGMYNYDNSAPVLTNVTISGNTVTGTGTSDNGGGMYNGYYASPVLTNVTISGNKAGNMGGGMANDGSTPKIRNSIIWGNTALVGDNGINNNSSTPEIKYSIVQDSTDGSNGNIPNVTVSPFVGWQDPGSVTVPNSGGDYSLNGSAGVNAGNDGIYPADADDPIFLPASLSPAAKTAINAALAKDLGGANRKNGPIDMGAYEKN